MDAHILLIHAFAMSSKGIDCCGNPLRTARLTVGSSVEVQLSGQDDLELMSLLSGPRQVSV